MYMVLSGMPLDCQKCHQETNIPHTSWHREVKVGFCSAFVHYWKLPLGFHHKSWHYADWDGFRSGFRSKWSEVSIKPALIETKKVQGFIHFCRCSRRFSIAYNLCVEVSWATCTLSSFVTNATTHQTFGVAELPFCHDVTSNMKPTVSPCVLRDLQLKCKPPFQAMPCCCELACTAQGKRGLKCWEVSVHLCPHTLVAFQCESVRRVVFSLAIPVFYFLTLHGQSCVMSLLQLMVKGNWLQFCSGGTFILTAHRRWTDLPATATYNSSLLHEIPSCHWLVALCLLFRVSCLLIYPLTFTRLTFPPHTFWK